MPKSVRLSRYIKKDAIAFGDAFADLSSVGFNTITVDSSDKNAVIANRIRVYVLAAINKESPSLASGFEIAIKPPNSDWCYGYCNIDKTEVLDYIKTIGDWLQANHASLPKTSAAFNKMLGIDLPKTEASTDTGTSSSSTSSETTSPSSDTSTNGSPPTQGQQLSYNLPLIIGGIVLVGAIGAFLVLRK